MSTDATTNLALPLVMPAQAQKHVTVNTGLLRLDALVQTRVESRTLAAEPGSPAEGAIWIVPPSATGAAWSLLSPGVLAHRTGGAWASYAPRAGWRVYVADEARSIVYDGARWRYDSEGLAEGAGGATTSARVIEGEASLSGAMVETTLVIPDRAIVLAVSTRTLEAVTGATSYACGIAGEPEKYGAGLGVAAGASNVGVTGPTAFYAPTPVRLTAAGGDFTGGRVGLAIHALVFAPPAG